MVWTEEVIVRQQGIGVEKRVKYLGNYIHESLDDEQDVMYKRNIHSKCEQTAGKLWMLAK